jgi:hypothetical protein
MKRLVIVSDAWHPQVNGVVRTLTKLREQMEARGVEVTIISPADYRSVGTDPSSCGQGSD